MRFQYPAYASLSPTGDSAAHSPRGCRRGRDRVLASGTDPPARYRLMCTPPRRSFLARRRLPAVTVWFSRVAPRPRFARPRRRRLLVFLYAELLSSSLQASLGTFAGSLCSHSATVRTFLRFGSSSERPVHLRDLSLRSAGACAFAPLRFGASHLTPASSVR